MVSSLKRFAATIAAIAFLSVGMSTAQALTVSFSTTGAFNDTPASPGTSPLVLNVGDATLTFTGSNIVNKGLPSSGAWTNVSFGSFTYTQGADLIDDEFDGTKFTLYITQSDPPASPDLGSFEGTAIEGTIFADVEGLGLKIQFDEPHVIYIPDGLTAAVKYQVDPIEIPASLTGAPADPAVLGGQVAAAPLPGVALAGMALMGCVGGLRKARNRRQELTVA